ncbi:NAD(P)/FAD-dependent oxidoreductase [Paenibacillus alkaliterrae]|uniref:NAD(P)/FAD-dependent oxidoreductase n=1 Tax=Paenibacillus alkaliterrae TaxID=320909 RepID=UPI001F46DB22|nr:NAD(P)/FAD-dependent oxidoreductase [Paenibacillus alkaliterrae]MCF2938206.1 NAD(P)/FAD-dependent oxidoreductase [Paenibacillus alkaliterrae]
MQVDCVIVGGGIAGLQAAIQLGRYRHQVAVIDAAGGRSTLCRCYHNLIGWPDGVSGSGLLAAGRSQAERLGVHFIRGKVVRAVQEAGGFILSTEENSQINGKRLLIATGVKDRLPDFPALIPCMGISVYVCPDCDGYEISDKRTIVLGAGSVGAEMALTLTHWTNEIIYINHELTALDDHIRSRLKLQGILYVEMPIRAVLTEESQFKGVTLNDGTTIESERCFVAFGGNKVRSAIAEQLGAELADNKHIIVDPRTKMTRVQHVWAAGDVTAHSEMVSIAMGDGSQAAIWIHKSLIKP